MPEPEIDQAPIDTGFDASDPVQVNNRKRDAGRKAADEEGFLRKALSDVPGRRFFWNFLGRCHLFEASFRDSAMDMSFREGERNIGLQMLAAIVKADPGAYLLMMQEANKEKPNV